MAASGTSIYVDPEDPEPNGSSQPRALPSRENRSQSPEPVGDFDPIINPPPEGPVGEEIAEKQNQDLKTQAKKEIEKEKEKEKEKIKLNLTNYRGLRGTLKGYVEGLRMKNVTNRDERKETKRLLAERRRLRRRQEEASKTLLAGGSPNKKNVTIRRGVRKGVRRLRL